MYLFRIFRSFLPLRNPIGFGTSDFIVLAIAILLISLLLAKVWLAPYLRELSKHPRWCMLALFALPVLLRIAMLPQSPVPTRSGADDFSYILLGDTLAHLRLANSTHPLYRFFEAVFVLQQPAYASIYPLGQGFVLAAGQILLHNAWAGVLLSSGALCALCYWMLRGWVAPVWALVGALLVVMEFGPLNSWVNSYWGGTISAIAGCMVFGSLPRLCRSPALRYGVTLGLGMGLQILTRPFESLFLALAAAGYLLFGLRGKSGLLTPAFGAIGLIAVSLGVTLLQNHAVTRSWTTMPYMLSRDQYGVPAAFTFQPNPVPHRPLTPEQDLDYKAQASVHGPGTDSLSEFFDRLEHRFRYLRFFLLPPLYVALLAVLPGLREPRYFWTAGTILLFALGTNIYPYFFPHYLAAVTCLFVLLSVRGLERLPSHARLYVLLLCGMAFTFWFGLYLVGDNDLLHAADYQSWNYVNRGDPQGRIAIAQQLAQSSGQQLVFVRYSPMHRFAEWIHNAADIDSAQTVWATDLGTEQNEQLLHYYPYRKAWLLEPDAHPPSLTPYSRDAGSFLTVH